MARRAIVEIQCDRCSRIDKVEEGKDELLCQIQFNNTYIEYKDLCRPCLAAVQNHIDAIGKKLEGRLSPDRKKRVVEAEAKKEVE